MGFEIYINSQPASTARALYTQLTPQMPDFVIGDTREVDIYIINPSGTLESFSGSASYAVVAAIGNVGAIPTSGTFTLTYGADTTSAIDYDATAAEVQAALNLLASIISAGGVVVTGTTGGFRIVFNNVGTRTAITGDGTNLNPSSSVFAMNAEAGDGSTRSIQLLRVRQTVIAFQDTWTQILDGDSNPIGWRAMIDTNTVESALALGDAASVSDLEFEIQTIASGVTTTWLQAPVVLRNDIIDPSTLTNVNLPDYLTSAEAASLYIAKTEYIAKRKFVQLSTNSTITANSFDIYEQTTAGITTTLWLTPTSGDCISITNTSGANTTIAGNGELIDTASTLTLGTGETADIVYNGTKWLII